MTFKFNPDSDIHIEIAEDILECLLSKSKWSMGSWSWLSLSNIKVYYDTKMVSTYQGVYTHEKVNLEYFLNHLAVIGIVERNPELFLRDQFFRLTQMGHEMLEKGGDTLYLYLSQHKY